MIIECIKFKNFLDCSATHPFIGSNKNNVDWVIKFHGNPCELGVRSILNDFLASKLADLIDLPWPQIFIIKLDSTVMTELRNKNYNPLSEWAVGSEYIEDLTPIKNTLKISPNDTNYETENAKKISEIFSNSEYKNLFYGKALFDNWLQMRDTKYETLHKTCDGKPMFLDATYAFYIDGAEEWSPTLCWNEAEMSLRSPYLPGIVKNKKSFNPWLEKVKKIKDHDFDAVFHQIPDDWKIPSEYIENLKNHLKSSSTKFVDCFENSMNLTYP